MRILHVHAQQKSIFVTLTYSLSFEMRHKSRCSVHRIPTHTIGSKAIIIIDVPFYEAITVVIRGTIRYGYPSLLNCMLDFSLTLLLLLMC